MNFSTDKRIETSLAAGNHENTSKGTLLRHVRKARNVPESAAGHAKGTKSAATLSLATDIDLHLVRAKLAFVRLAELQCL